MTKPAPYRLERQRGRLIVTLLPELNDVPWSDIEKIGSDLVQQLKDAASPALLVDLCALHYMGSAQVALVVRLFKTVKEQRGRMVVANRDPIVQEVLNLAGLDKLWTIVPSAETGLRLLGGTVDSGLEGSSGLGWALTGLACLALSVAALLSLVLSADWVPEATALWTQFAAALGGFLLGLWCVLRGAGSPKSLGTGVVVASVALMLASVFVLGGLRSEPAGIAREPRPNSPQTVMAHVPVPNESDMPEAMPEETPIDSPEGPTSPQRISPADSLPDPSRNAAPPGGDDAPPADATQPSVP